MIKGIGIDIVQVKRIENILNKWGDKLLNRIYTDQEKKYCQKKDEKYIHLAARFAAKEALVKMLGTGMKQIKWSDIEIINDERGKPKIKLYGNADKEAEKQNINNIHISISHEKEYAVAQVIGEDN